MIDNARIGEASSDFAIRIAAQVVGHDDFNVAVVAVYSTGDRAAQISRAVVSRDHNADQRGVGGRHQQPSRSAAIVCATSKRSA